MYLWLISTPLPNSQRNDKQSSESDGHIRKIENPGSEKTDVDVQKIRHGAISHAVNDVANSSTDDTTDAKGYAQTRAAQEKPENKAQHGKRGQKVEQQRFNQRAKILANAQESAGVLDFGEHHMISCKVNLLMIFQSFAHNGFGDLVAADIGGDEKQEKRVSKKFEFFHDQ